MISSSQVTQATINKILSAIGWKGKWESTQQEIVLSVPQPVVEDAPPLVGFSSGDLGAGGQHYSVGLRHIGVPTTVETPVLTGFVYNGPTGGTRPSSGGSSGGGGGRGGGGGKKGGGGGKGKKGGSGSKKDKEDKKD